jgi:hypothetical protein
MLDKPRSVAKHVDQLLNHHPLNFEAARPLLEIEWNEPVLYEGNRIRDFPWPPPPDIPLEEDESLEKLALAMKSHEVAWALLALRDAHFPGLPPVMPLPHHDPRAPRWLAAVRTAGSLDESALPWLRVLLARFEKILHQQVRELLRAVAEELVDSGDLLRLIEMVDKALADVAATRGGPFDLFEWQAKVDAMWKQAGSIPLSRNRRLPDKPVIKYPEQLWDASKLILFWVTGARQPRHVSSATAAGDEDGPFEPLGFRWQGQIWEFAKSQRRYHRLAIIVWSLFRTRGSIYCGEVSDELRRGSEKTCFSDGALRSYASKLSAILAGRCDGFPARLVKDGNYLRWQSLPDKEVVTNCGAVTP